VFTNAAIFKKVSNEVFLQTKRLKLRKFENSHRDLVLLHALNSDPDVMRFIRKPDATLEGTKAYFDERILSTYYDQGFGVWALELLDGTFVGFALLITLKGTTEKEVGYRLHKKFWGHGYATEIANALVEYGFGKGLTRIVGITHPENFASQRVLEKCGLTYERDTTHYDIPVKLYAITK
jgi:[ribosomal protein S5]-alanine N-acetyltransferase